MEFWSTSPFDLRLCQAIEFYSPKDFPLFIKKELPIKLYALKLIFEQYYHAEYMGLLEYKVEHNKVESIKLINDYNVYENTAGLYSELDAEIVNPVSDGYTFLKQYFKSNFIDYLNSTLIKCPNIKIHSNLYLRDANLLSNAIPNCEMIRELFTQLFNEVHKLVRLNLEINSLTLEHVYSYKGFDNSRKIFLFIPHLVSYQSNIKDNNSIAQLKKFIELFIALLRPDKYAEKRKADLVLLKQQLWEIVERINKDIYSNQISFKSIPELSKFLTSNEKSKTKVYAFIDWPNVDQNVFGNDIDWSELMNTVLQNLYDVEAIKNTTVEISSITFFKYLPEVFSDEDKVLKNKNDTDRINGIINVLRENYSSDLDITSGETQYENQLVDKKIIDRISSVFKNSGLQEALLLFTSDTDFIDGFNSDYLNIRKLLSNGILVILVSFGFVSNRYRELIVFPNFKIFEINHLYRFIGK